MQNIARLLRKDGVTVFSDILEAPNVDQAQLRDVYSRLDLTSMGNHELYDKTLTAAGMQRVVKDVDAAPIIKHYGMILYSATALKRDELLGPDGVSKEFLEKQIAGLWKWVECGAQGLVEQGWFVYRK